MCAESTKGSMSSPFFKKARNKRTVASSTKCKSRKNNGKQPKIKEFLNQQDDKKSKYKASTSKNGSKESSSPSFEKYGVKIPTFEKIMEDWKKFDEHKKRTEDLFAMFDESILERKIDVRCLKGPEKFTGELLDCKQLSLDELKKAFDRHLVTLRHIMDGKIMSERHALFYNYNVKYNFTFKDLRCSSSLIVFEQEQIDHLLKLMGKVLDPEDKKLDYFFKVLLPELCLLIFMDTHNMTKEQAIEYLDKRPIDND